MQRTRNLAIKSQLLLPLAALALLSTIGTLVPIEQIDFWWHVAIGRDIAASHTIPMSSSHSWILPPKTPFIYGSWLAEWLMYQLYRIGNLPLLVTIRTLLLVLNYSLVGLEAHRRTRSWRAATAAIVGASLITLNNLNIRPQMFAWVTFTLTALLLGAFRSGTLARRWLAVVPLLMIFWVNVHGSFIIGIGLIGLTCAGETAKIVLRRGQRLPITRAAWLCGTGLLSIAATLINPTGSAIFGFVSNLVGHPATRQFVNEWQPPALLGFPGVLVPLALVLLALGWLRQRPHVDLTDALLIGTFTYLGVSSIRNLIWFGMLAWPIVVGALAKPQAASRPARRSRLATIVAISIVALCITMQPPVRSALAGESAIDQNPPYRSLIDPSTPLDAIRWLDQHTLPANARLFHDMRFGSYLIWALPQTKVYVDGRIELYPLDEWLRYRRIIRDQDALRELDGLGATHALLSNDAQPALIRTLQQPASGWTQRYADAVTTIFERTGGQEP